MSLPAPHSLLRLICLVFVCLPGGTAPLRAAGQSPVPPAGLPEEAGKIEQNETMLDTLKRMQIKREEIDFQKLVEKAATIRSHTTHLAGEIRGESSRLSRDDEKRLREIEKFARQIRSESGGGETGEPTTDEAGMEELVERLRKAGEALAQAMGRTSRRVISVSVIMASSELIELSRRIRRQAKPQ